MDLFSKAYQEHVQKMRKKFFQAGSVEGITGIRPEVLACWEAAYQNDIQPNDAKKKIASQEEFAAALSASRDLLAVAEPYMRRLLSFLDPESFWVALVDRNGIILRLVGSPTMLKVARATELVEGSYRGGDAPYPGLYYACLQMNQSIQIVSGEHPSRIDDGLAGSAAPIHDHNTGETLGVIGISGYYEKSHGHTLGLTVMAAEAIAQELELRRLQGISSDSEITQEQRMIRADRRGAAASEADLRGSLPREAETLLGILRRHQGNISEAARAMGVSRPTIYRSLKKYGINPTEKWLFI